MLTFDKVIQTPLGSYVKGFCLTSDELPTTGFANGSIIEQLNPATGVVDIYRFDGSSSAWVKTVSNGVYIESELPAIGDGDTGKVLTVGSSGPEWATASSGGSGGGVLVVTDTDGTLNKTWQEIHDADFAVVTWEDATDKYTRPVSSLYADGGEYGVIVSAPTGTTEYMASAASGYPEMEGGGGGGD